MPKEKIGSPILIDFWGTPIEAETDVAGVTIAFPQPGKLRLIFPSGRWLEIEQIESDTQVSWEKP